MLALIELWEQSSMRQKDRYQLQNICLIFSSCEEADRVIIRVQFAICGIIAESFPMFEITPYGQITN